MQSPLTPDKFVQSADRRQIRQMLRARRNELTSAQRQLAAQGVANTLCLAHAFRRAKYIALYLANDGELDPSQVAHRAWALGKTCYLPVLDAGLPVMHFARWRPGDKLIRNRFGIPEPLPKAPRIAAQTLDLVCMPLVGFDPQGNRMGMGGGFYDRTFSYRLHHPKAKPLLVGIAHQCQQLEALPVAPWDVPLDMVVTDESSYSRGPVGKMLRSRGKI